LKEAGVNIIGTSPDAIDLAEDRKKFLSKPKSIRGFCIKFKK
jgi:carbamoylphosphate synthase large subunit